MHTLRRCRSSLLTLALLVMLFPMVPVNVQSAPHSRSSAARETLEILPDHRVVFRIDAPKASTVALKGDWIDSNHRNAMHMMTRGTDGGWSITEGPLTPDFYLYSYLIDTAPARNSSHGSSIQERAAFQHMFEVPGDEATFADDRRVPHGQVAMVSYYSDAAGAMRRMHVYTPPGYGDGTRYPVLYLLAGADDDGAWLFTGRANFILDNLLADGKSKPMIVVMPDIHIGQPTAATTAAARMTTVTTEQDAFARELTSVIVPYVEKNFRALPGSEQRALAGLSAGGRVILRIVPSYPDLFAYLGIFSTGLQKGSTQQVPDDFEQHNAAFLQNPDQANRRIRLLWIAAGIDDDRVEDGGKILSQMLAHHGIKNEYRKTEGGHSWLNWRHYLFEYAQRLFQQPTG